MKKDIFFKIVYLIFLFLIVSGSNLYFAGITLKYVITIFLFVLIIFKENDLKLDKCFKFYIGFIFVFFLSSVFANQISPFFNTFFRFYFTSYVAFHATSICIKDDFSFVNIIIIILLLLGIFDVAVTYSQFTLNISWYEPIRELFQFAVDEDFEEFVNNRSWLTTKSLAYGVFASAAMNGYYLALFCIISVYPYLVTKKIWFLLLPFLFLIGLFVCQERSPFYLSVLLLLYILLKFMKSLSLSKKFIIFLGAIILIVFGTEYLLNMSEGLGLRYTERGFDGTGRDDIQAGYWEYLASNPIIPNYYELLDCGKRPPHNLFLNALVYGGPLSLILILNILAIQSKRAWMIIKNMNYSENYSQIAVTLGWVVFMANSLVHNRSIVTGEVILWVLWAIMSFDRTVKN